MTVRCRTDHYAPTLYWQMIAANREQDATLCDSTVPGPAIRRHTELECGYPPFKTARSIPAKISEVSGYTQSGSGPSVGAPPYNPTSSDTWLVHDSRSMFADLI